MAFALFGKKKTAEGDDLDQQLAQLNVFMSVVGDESDGDEAAVAPAPEDGSVDSNQNDPARRSTINR